MLCKYKFFRISFWATKLTQGLQKKWLWLIKFTKKKTMLSGPGNWCLRHEVPYLKKNTNNE